MSQEFWAGQRVVLGRAGQTSLVRFEWAEEFGAADND